MVGRPALTTGETAGDLNREQFYFPDGTKTWRLFFRGTPGLSWFVAVPAERIINLSPMTPGRIACVLSVMAAVCVLSLFFFPGIEGPYPAVHGPVTALLSIRAAARLRVLIRAGVRVARNCLACQSLGLVPLLRIENQSAESGLNGLSAGSSSVLRC